MIQLTLLNTISSSFQLLGYRRNARTIGLSRSEINSRWRIRIIKSIEVSTSFLCRQEKRLNTIKYLPPPSLLFLPVAW
jgi:hypothetical protein